MKFTDLDHYYMSLAVSLAQKAKGRTFPNPAVGAVIVSGNAVVGKGATSFYGGPHAEKIALKKAGKSAKNAALYVTLEPCNHFGMTPPCTDDIIASGIKKAYISMRDPNPIVNGRGIRHLLKNGITVYCGLLEKEAREMNEDFFWSITRKTSWVTLKLALTLDGRIADGNGRSRWITSADSRAFVHDLRRRHAAVAVGAGTLLKDNPRLSVRHVPGVNPARIVFSSSPNLPATSYFIKDARKIRSIIVISGGKRPEVQKKIGRPEIWYTGTNDKGKSLRVFLRMAYVEGLSSILVEGGCRVASLFLERRLVNRLYLFFGNKLLGKGLDGFRFTKGLRLSKAIRLHDSRITTVGSDIMVTGVPE